jgi:hypothetical protein
MEISIVRYYQYKSQKKTFAEKKVNFSIRDKNAKPDNIYPIDMKRVLGEIPCGCLSTFIAKQIRYRITQKPPTNVATSTMY